MNGDDTGLVPCGDCATVVPATDTWCEACGAALPPPATDTGPRPSDRVSLALDDEVAGQPAAAVTDRGRRRAENQDAVAIDAAKPAEGARQRVVLVVSDGVASTGRAASASTDAVAAAVPVMVDPGLTPAEAMMAGVAAGQAAAAKLGDPSAPDEEPPSATIVASVVDAADQGYQIVGGWLGDSRAYWLGSDGNQQLTHDHQIGGAISRWLGADSQQPQPDTFEFDADGEGLLLLCSDGLWGFASDADEMGAVVNELADQSESLLDLSNRLADWANECGGYDNISVAVWASPTWRTSRLLGGHRGRGSSDRPNEEK